MTFKVLLMAVGLMLLLEGGVIGLSPGGWRRAVTQLLQQNDETLRLFGLVFVLLGAAILWFVI